MAMEIWFPVWRFYLQIRNDRSFAAVVLSLNHRSGRVSQWECKPFANAGMALADEFCENGATSSASYSACADNSL